MTMNSNSTASALGTATLRFIAGIVGALIIACVTWATVASVGGIWAPTAPLLIALAGGLVVGALCVGIACRARRWTVVAGLILTLCAGEAYTLLSIGERELEAREAKQAPVRAAMVERARLEKAVTSTPRLAAALEAQEAVRERASKKIAEASCVKLCHDVLTKQQAAADREVEIARAEASEKADAANAALAAIPAVAAVSPLAARINVPDWVLDLIRAGLFSVSANGLGAFLLAFSSHSGRKSVPGVQSVPAEVPVETPKALSFERPLSDDEIEQIKKALNGLNRPVTNDELAALLGCTKSEGSKRWRKAAAAGVLSAQRSGKFVHLRLVA
jgi:hypothetical protein